MLARNQRAMVTGASSGIGRAVATALAERGLHVIFVGRDETKLSQVSKKAGPNTRSVVADLTTEAGRAAAAKHAAPELHVLVHSAGQYLRCSTEELSAERWSALDSINLHAPILLTSACLPQLRSAAGQVVFINSSAGLSASLGLAAYVAGKRGLQAAADTLRQEVNKDGIRVLSVFPGRTDTPMQQALLAAEQRIVPPDMLMRPEDIADMVISSLTLPRTAEVTDIFIRPMRKL